MTHDYYHENGDIFTDVICGLLLLILIFTVGILLIAIS